MTDPDKIQDIEVVMEQVGTLVRHIMKLYDERRTTVPDGYRLLHRTPADSGHESVWAVLCRSTGQVTARGVCGTETQIGASVCRVKACKLAWDHRDDPKLFDAHPYPAVVTADPAYEE